MASEREADTSKAPPIPLMKDPAEDQVCVVSTSCTGPSYMLTVPLASLRVQEDEQGGLRRMIVQASGVEQVKAQLAEWQRQGQISEVESVHLGLLDGRQHIEVSFSVPEARWLAGEHYALYRSLREMQRADLMITPTASPNVVERAE